MSDETDEPTGPATNQNGQAGVVVNESDYEAFRADIKVGRGYPTGTGSVAGTREAFPPLEKMKALEMVDGGQVYLALGPQDRKPEDEPTYEAHAAEIEVATKWEQGQIYGNGKVVWHGDVLWISFIDNNSYEPGVGDINGWRDPADIPTWSQPVGNQGLFHTGDQCMHGGKKWESERDNNVWEPGTFDSGWKDMSPPVESDEWTIGTAYAVDDEVTYEADRYRCLQAHTAQAGWEPPNVPALWEIIK